jgi:hypothetical protein
VKRMPPFGFILCPELNTAELGSCTLSSVLPPSVCRVWLGPAMSVRERAVYRGSGSGQGDWGMLLVTLCPSPRPRSPAKLEAGAQTPRRHSSSVGL